MALGIDFLRLAIHLQHGIAVQDPHQVEPEPVHVIFRHPVFDGIHDEFPRHGFFRGEFVAAAGPVRVTAGLVHPVVITRKHLVENGRRTRTGGGGVIENHVHDHADVVPVKGLNHFLEFLLPGGAIGIRGVGTSRRVKENRIVAPVIPGVFIRLLPFIAARIIKTPAADEHGSRPALSNDPGRSPRRPASSCPVAPCRSTFHGYRQRRRNFC